MQMRAREMEQRRAGSRRFDKAHTDLDAIEQQIETSRAAMEHAGDIGQPAQLLDRR